jgi:hypothetical protein
MSGHSAHGAYANHAREYFDYGMATLPLGGDDGKVPLISGFHKHAAGPDAIDKFSRQFPDANLGFLPAMSMLYKGGCMVVVDIDTPDEAEQKEVLKRFGDTPIKVRTGSNHMQAWFRSGRRISSRDLRQSEGMPVEIKCDGTLCVAPPSVNPKKGAYSFLSGSLDDLGLLPEINLSSLTVPSPRTAEGRQIDVGLRNNTLFRQCLRDARHVDDLDALIDCAQSYADVCFVDPLTPAEIEKTARSAWGYEERGENWVGTEAKTLVTLSYLKQVIGDAPNKHSDSAFVLLLLLKLEHSGRQARGEPFMMVLDAMARDGCLPGWTLYQYRNAAKVLLEAGYIECVFQGGRSKHSPSLYFLTPKATNVAVNTAKWEPDRWLN